MTMEGRPLEDLIQADLDGELGATERADLARRLLLDPDARRLHDQLRQTDRLLREVRAEEPPPGLRTAILSATAASTRRTEPRQRALPAYRIAAIVLGAFVIVGLGYILGTTDRPAGDLQGSLGAAADGRLQIRSDDAEVRASLRRDGGTLTLELVQSSTVPCEVIARIDPATTALVGTPVGVRRSTASGQVTIPFEAGTRIVELKFSGAAPIDLELHAGGRLLGKGRLAADGS